VSLAARASEGAALGRVDTRLGVDYFAGMYGRASDVFGAMPSLHCAYLDHRWVLDVLAGLTYGASVLGAARAIAWVRAARPVAAAELADLGGSEHP
jgi:hypothetical protein